MANNTTTISCAYKKQILDALFIDYAALAPIYLFVGIVGHILALITYYKQTAKEKVYVYAIMFSLSKILEISNSSAQGIVRLCTYEGSPCYSGVFKTSYTLLLCNIVWGTVLSSAITISICALASMAADRALALGRPFVYKNINHKRHAIVAVLICLSFGIFVSLDNAFHHYIVPVGQAYALVTDPNFNANIIGPVMMYTRTIIRVVAVCVVVIGNALMIKYFKKQNKVISKLMTQADEQREKDKKKREKSIFLIVLSQSVSNGLMLGANIIYNFLAPLYPLPIYNCEIYFVNLIYFCFVRIFDVIDIMVALAVNIHFRKWFFEAVRCCKGDNVTSVVTAARMPRAGADMSG